MKRDRRTHRPDFVELTFEACPRPDKTKFRNRQEAKRTMRLKKSVLTEGKTHAYHCVCGAWHFGHRRLTERSEMLDSAG